MTTLTCVRFYPTYNQWIWIKISTTESPVYSFNGTGQDWQDFYPSCDWWSLEKANTLLQRLNGLWYPIIQPSEFEDGSIKHRICVDIAYFNGRRWKSLRTNQDLKPAIAQWSLNDTIVSNPSPIATFILKLYRSRIAERLEPWFDKM